MAPDTRRCAASTRMSDLAATYVPEIDAIRVDIPGQGHRYTTLLTPAQALALVGRVDGDGSEKQHVMFPDQRGPVADDGGKRAAIVAQRQAEGRNSRHAIAQAIGGQRRAARGETEVVERLDLPPVVFSLFLKPVHACAFPPVLPLRIRWPETTGNAP